MRRLKAADVMHLLGIKSLETLRQMVLSKKLPAPIRDCEGGPRYWLESDITGYIERGARARNPAEAQPQAMAA